VAKWPVKFASFLPRGHSRGVYHESQGISKTDL